MTTKERDLTDDRKMEWGFCVSHMPTGKKVLDIGCCNSLLAHWAMESLNDVVGIDISNKNMENNIHFKFIQSDILDFTTDKKFDFVMLCSTVEHVGLHGRYNNIDDPDGDLKTMEKIKGLLAPRGQVCLTIPIGQDAVIKCMHRIYGKTRLPKLLSGYKIIREEFCHKENGENWKQISGEHALEIEGSKKYYCLGLFLLEVEK